MGGLPGVDPDKPLFCPNLQDIQRLLQSIVYSCKVFLREPQDQIVAVYGSQDFMRRVSDDVVCRMVLWFYQDQTFSGQLD